MYTIVESEATHAANSFHIKVKNLKNQNIEDLYVNKKKTKKKLKMGMSDTRLKRFTCTHNETRVQVCQATLVLQRMRRQQQHN